MRRIFVDRAGEELEATLTDIADPASQTQENNDKRDFELLKTYLMLYDLERLDVDFATGVLVSQWQKRLHPDVAQETKLLKTNASRYIKLMKAEHATWLDDKDNDGLVRNVRQALRARDAQFKRIVREANKRVRPFDLRMARLDNQTMLKSSYEVPGAYTREGWTDYIRKQLIQGELAGGERVEPWVLGEEENVDLTKRLRKRYYEQYIGHWLKFLEGLSLKEPANAKESLFLLEKLTDEPPIYKTLFESVIYHTQMPLFDAGKLKKMKLPGKLGKLKKLTKHADKLKDKRKLNAVELKFKPLWELIDPPIGIDGKPLIAGMSQYQEQLGSVREALSEQLKSGEKDKLDQATKDAFRITRGVMNTLPGSLKRRVRRLFFQPLEMATSTAMDADQAQTGKAVKEELCPAVNEKIKGRYPFAKRGADALLSDAEAVFARDSGIVWSYFRDHLSRKLEKKAGRFVARPNKKVAPAIVSFFSSALRITQAIYGLRGSTPALDFDVRPRPAVIREGSNYLISEIIFEVDGTRKTYRNGPMEEWQFSWTGKGKRALLLVKGSQGLREPLKGSGPWGILKLLKQAKIRRNGSWRTATWTLKDGAVQVQMDFRPRRSYNILFTDLSIDCRL